jgi:hypothetical protein
MATMLEARSPGYVQGWLLDIARKTGVVDYELARIIENVTGQTGAYAPDKYPGTQKMVDDERAAEIIGGMTTEQAQQVIGRAREFRAVRFPNGSCDFCGLALDRSGECVECV